LALCPNCKMDIRGDNVMSEQLGPVLNAVGDSFVELKVRTTMYSCPGCHVIVGIAQYTTY